MEGTAMDEHLFNTSSIVVQLPQPVAAFVSATRADESRAYLRRCCAGPWCFLTAHDPGGEPLSDEENEERNGQAVEHVTKLGHGSVTQGNIDCPAWLPLGGILTIGIAEAHARRLGHELCQSVIIVGIADSCRILYSHHP